jgi:hypothetical protein
MCVNQILSIIRWPLMNVSLEPSLSSWSYTLSLQGVWTASDIAFDLYVTHWTGAYSFLDNSSISIKCVDIELYLGFP